MLRERLEAGGGVNGSRLGPLRDAGLDSAALATGSRDAERVGGVGRRAPSESEEVRSLEQPPSDRGVSRCAWRNYQPSPVLPVGR